MRKRGIFYSLFSCGARARVARWCAFFPWLLALLINDTTGFSRFFLWSKGAVGEQTEAWPIFALCLVNYEFV
jgi:hypothetical protein